VRGNTYFCRKGDAFMKKKEQKNFFVKMVEDKKAIIILELPIYIDCKEKEFFIFRF
jgi:hypothetical protein